MDNIPAKRQRKLRLLHDNAAVQTVVISQGAISKYGFQEMEHSSNSPSAGLQVLIIYFLI